MARLTPRSASVHVSVQHVGLPLQQLRHTAPGHLRGLFLQFGVLGRTAAAPLTSIADGNKKLLDHSGDPETPGSRTMASEVYRTPETTAGRCVKVQDLD
ncbi:hypothetical protein V7S43_012302 [Phytophthora oleae]|uniref:Uncharacterized protein n=1 Tax=Phytophthora oleae TaxID=2107226 RepID=A0ABD3F810_9STRA